MGLFDIFKKKKTVIIDGATDNNSSKNERNIKVEVVDDIPSLDSRIKNSYPSENGLYPHEILMLEYAEVYKTCNNSFQSFWRWNYSVLEPQKVLDSLYERGFICLGSVKECLEKEKVTVLKELLSKKSEKKTGKKAELIDRILGVYANDELEKLFPEKYYALTDLGRLELQENEYVIYAHRKMYLSAWDVNILIHTTNNYATYRDVIWGELNRRCLEYIQSKNYGLYRNTRLNMYDFLIEEGKYIIALQQLVEVVSYDFSGLGNSEEKLESLDFSVEELAKFKMSNLFLDNETNEIIVLQGLLNYFERLKKELDLPKEEFVELIYEKFNMIQIRNRIFDGTECANILLYQLGLEDKKVDNSYENAYKRATILIK